MMGSVLVENTGSYVMKQIWARNIWLIDLFIITYSISYSICNHGRYVWCEWLHQDCEQLLISAFVLQKVIGAVSVWCFSDIWSISVVPCVPQQNCRANNEKFITWPICLAGHLEEKQMCVNQYLTSKWSITSSCCLSPLQALICCCYYYYFCYYYYLWPDISGPRASLRHHAGAVSARRWRSCSGLLRRHESQAGVWGGTSSAAAHNDPAPAGPRRSEALTQRELLDVR